jgi:hypothetical protein
VNFTQNGFSFGFISDQTTPGGWDLQCPPGPIVPVYSGPALDPTQYVALVANGTNTAVANLGLAPAATATYQQAIAVYLETIETLVVNVDTAAAYASAYSTLQAAIDPYNTGLAMIPGESATLDGVTYPIPLGPKLYAVDGNEYAAILTAWGTFLTTVYNLAASLDSAAATAALNTVNSAYAVWYAAYTPALDAYDAAVSAAEAAYSSAVTAYDAQVAVYLAARSAAIAWKAANP